MGQTAGFVHSERNKVKPSRFPKKTSDLFGMKNREEWHTIWFRVKTSNRYRWNDYTLVSSTNSSNLEMLHKAGDRSNQVGSWWKKTIRGERWRRNKVKGSSRTPAVKRYTSKRYVQQHVFTERNEANFIIISMLGHRAPIRHWSSGLSIYVTEMVRESQTSGSFRW